MFFGRKMSKIILSMATKASKPSFWVYQQEWSFKSGVCGCVLCAMGLQMRPKSAIFYFLPKISCFWGERCQRSVSPWLPKLLNLDIEYINRNQAWNLGTWLWFVCYGVSNKAKNAIFWISPLKYHVFGEKHVKDHSLHGYQSFQT